MKCPNCGEEIRTILVEGTELVWIREVYEETADGSFKFSRVEDEDAVDYEMEEILCPKCEKPIDPSLVRFIREENKRA
ncbi:MAG: hypothetical protein DRP01_00975 [Archaeoglobales archaeon]|nr:MAG: hypothetical protein DRP01_00975 [Archaeoglobales archaeon]